MLETSARLLRLLTLLQTRRFWSGAELSERLDVTGRTLRRDVERLRSLGYPVRATPGVAGGYQLAAGATLPPLQLADDEALAVSVALQTAATSAVTGVEEAAIRALIKLERVLPGRLRKRANALRSATSLLSRTGPRVSADVLTAIATACSERLQIRFSYQKPESDRNRFRRDGAKHAKPVIPPPGDLASSETVQLAERRVEPLGLVSSGYRWYLVGWDLEREGWRTFRVDRVLGEVRLGGPFTPRKPPYEGTLQDYVSRSVSVEAYEQRARVALHIPLAIASERISPAAGVLSHLDENRCLLLTGAGSLETLAVHLLLLGCEFEVVEPRSLVGYLRELHARLGRTLS